MKTFVISLDRTPERYAEFIEENPWCEHERFSAVDGAAVSRDSLIEQGIFSQKAPPQWVPGAIGCYLSHRVLWQWCVDHATPITVCEDDVILSPSLPENYERILATLRFDLMVWGCNLDTHVIYQLPNANISVESTFGIGALAQSKAAFRSTPVEATALRLIACYGLPCYTVTPEGADKLIKSTMHMTNSAYYPYGKVVIKCLGYDAYLNEVYAKIKAYVTIPPCALTMIDQDVTTISGRWSQKD